MGQIRDQIIKRVVVRGTNWVGDSVMTVPALRALRRVLPEAEITLAIRPGTQGLFADAEFVDNILVYDRRGLLSVMPQVRKWRQGAFDLAILFQNAFEAALIPFLAGVPWRTTRHEVFYYLYLVTALEQLLFGTSSICEQEPDAGLELSESRKEEATRLLNSHGVTSESKLVAICPGSINSRAKRWPAEAYAALADLLIEDHSQVLLIGSKEEMDVSHQVTTRMRHQATVLTGQTSLDQITAVLGLVDLVVTNDTGPAHVAAALGRPTLVIFGPTNPLTTRPFSLQAEILRHPPECAPCMLRDCPIDHRCMTAITVEEVFQRSRLLLKRGNFARTVRSLCDSVA